MNAAHMLMTRCGRLDRALINSFIYIRGGIVCRTGQRLMNAGSEDRKREGRRSQGRN